MFTTAAKALHIDKSKPATTIDQMRQEAFERTNDIITETPVQKSKNPLISDKKYTYSAVYCGLLAKKLGVSEEWSYLSGGNPHDCRYLKKDPPSICRFTDSPNHEIYAPPHQAPRRFTDSSDYEIPTPEINAYAMPIDLSRDYKPMPLTQEQYDKLYLIQQDQQALTYAFEPEIHQTIFNETLPPGGYEILQDDKGNSCIHGRPDFPYNDHLPQPPKDVYLQPTYGSHELTHTEILTLLRGDEISIPTRSGTGTFKLDYESPDSPKFGIQRTETSNQRSLPDISDPYARTVEQARDHLKGRPLPDFPETLIVADDMELPK